MIFHRFSRAQADQIAFGSGGNGNEVVLNAPEQFEAFFRGEMDRWAKAIRDAGIKLE